MPLLLFFPLVWAASAFAAASVSLAPDLVVAADGSGDFRSIHAAVQSIPRDNRERKIIFVKSGIYTEQVRVDVACVTLRGESRTETRLQFSRAQTDWPPDGDRAVLNLGATAHDFVLENFTIENTHRQRGLHAFAILGPADRTVLLNSEVISQGHHPRSLGRSRADPQAIVGAPLPEGTTKAWRDGAYLHGSPRLGGDFPWHRVYLYSAPGTLRPDAIAAAGTFAHRWNPERTDAPRILQLRHQAQPDRLMVTFSETITVRGCPRLVFPNGDAAELLGGSGTDVLEFSSLHAAFSGTTPKLELNGGAIFSSEAGVHVRMARLALP